MDAYSYYGEGCWKIWANRQFSVVCDLQKGPSPTEDRQEWWVQVETKTGVTAWTKGREPMFVSQEQMNNELSQKIMEPNVALPVRLARIDALIREGAQLNGSAGQYGTDPRDAVTQSLNVDILHALTKRGLRIENGESGCTAHWMHQVALQPGADSMLEALFEEGLQLECLSPGGGREAPMPAFLRFGINGNDYPVERAIRIAAVLVKHGVDVNQRGFDKKSVFDVLDEQIPKNPSLIKLRDALTELSRVAESGKAVEPNPQGQPEWREPGSTETTVLADVFSVGNGVSAPAVLYKVDPEYSEEARRAKYSGTVLLSVIVDAEGKGRDIRVVKSLGMGLDEKAVEAVQKWKFKPGMKGGAAVNVRAQIEVNFRML